MERVQHQVHGATATAGTTDGTLPTASLRHPPCRYPESIFAYLTLLQVPHPDQVALVHQATLAYFRVNYIPKKWAKVRDGILRLGCICEKAAGKGYEKLYGLMRYVYRVLALFASTDCHHCIASLHDTTTPRKNETLGYTSMCINTVWVRIRGIPFMSHRRH